MQRLDSPPIDLQDLRDRVQNRLEGATERANARLLSLALAARERLDRFLADEMQSAPRLHVYPSESAGESGDWVVFHGQPLEPLTLAAAPEEARLHTAGKTEAVQVARELAREQGAILVIHRTDGSVQSTYHYEAYAEA